VENKMADNGKTLSGESLQEGEIKLALVALRQPTTVIVQMNN